MKEKTKKKKKSVNLKKILYTCPHCNKQFADSSSWHCHVKLHSTEEPYHCEICPYKCKIKKYLSRHMKKAHSKPTGNQCVVCGKCFHFECKLKIHMRVHTGEKPHKCDVCDKAFSSTYSLSVHKYIHTGEKPFQCSYCDYKCRDHSTIRRHEERHMGISKNFPCSICKKNFKKKETLKIHVDEVHFELETRKFPCEQCDKVFKTKGTLNIHNNTVHNKANRIKCEICGTRVTRTNIQAHMRRHIDVKPYKCSYKPCGRRFKDKGDLKKHSLIHYPDRQHQCKICDRKFARRSRLTKHALWHLNKRNVQCDYCNIMFRNKKYLLRHIQNKHGPGSRRYICDLCGLVTYSRRSITMHLKYGHGTEKDTMCQICKKDYNRYISLKEHYLSHHNIKYFLLPKKKEDEPVIKEEPPEEFEQVIENVNEAPEFLYEVNIQKQEMDADMLGEEILKPQEAANYPIDSDTITYSKKVLSEDISRSLIERDRYMPEDEFDDFFIGHVMKKPEELIEMPKDIVDEKKKEQVEKCLEKLLSKIRLRKETKALEKLRRRYNKRIKMATSTGINKKEHKSIRYFKKPEKTNESPDLQNTEKDISNNDNNINDKEINVVNNKIDDQEVNKNNDREINDNDKGIARRSNRPRGEVHKNNDQEIDNNDDQDDGDEDYKDSDEESVNSDEEVNKNGKLKFNTHQCYICFKLFKTKSELKRHCKDHFDLCNDKILKKCPFCGYVTNLQIQKHIRLVHKIFIDIPYGRIKERDTQNGSKYVYEIDKNCDLEIIPSISNLNKIASMKIDEKNRASRNIFLGTTKLVKKGGDWVVEKQPININSDYILPEFTNEEYRKLKSVGNTYLERIRSLSILAKKKGVKILYPCEGCDKICLTLSALKLHNRKHEVNPKAYKPKVWKNKILNGYQKGKNSKINNKHRKKYSNKNQNSAENIKTNNKTNANNNNNKTIKHRRLKIVDKNDANNTVTVANRFAEPNPVKNKHKCDKELIEFYKTNIKGGDIEFWQFLKIFNKMSRENVNDFTDLEKRSDFGTHNIINYDQTKNTVADDTVQSNTEVNVESNPVNRRKSGRIKKKFTRAIMISKKEYLKRIELKNQMRKKLEESKSKT